MVAKLARDAVKQVSKMAAGARKAVTGSGAATGSPGNGSGSTTRGQQAAPAKKAPAAKAPVRKAAGNTAPIKRAAPAKTAPAKKAAVKAAPAKKSPAKKAPAAKAPAKKAAEKTAPTKKTAPAKKPPATKTAVTVAPVKKAVPARKAAPAKKAVPPSKAPPAKRISAPRVPRRSTPSMVPFREGETPWTAAQLRGVRAELDTDIAQLRAELEHAHNDLVDLMRDSGDGAGDDQADAGAKTYEREQEISLANNAREMLEQSEHALERLDDGTYGICESCGSAIGKLRLQAAPRATLCMPCKIKQERR